MSARQKILHGHGPSNINLVTLLSLFNPLLFAESYNHFPLLTVSSIIIFWKDMSGYYSSYNNMHFMPSSRFSWSFLFRALFVKTTPKKINVVWNFFLLEVHVEKKCHQTATAKRLSTVTVLYLLSWRIFSMY